MENDEAKMTKSGSIRLTGKKTKGTSKSKAEHEQCSNALISEQSSEGTAKSKAEQEGSPSNEERCEGNRWRLKLPRDCSIPLYELYTDLDLKSMGAAVGWIVPSETKRLFKLTKELGYENGGHTIDWLVQMANKGIISLTQELGLQNGGEALSWSVPTETTRELTRELGIKNGAKTLDYLISMATKPTLELHQSLGSEDSPKSIEWLSKQPCIGATRNKLPPNFSSTMDNIPPQFPTQQFQAPTFQHLGEAPTDMGSSSKQEPIINDNFLYTEPLGPSAGIHGVPTSHQIIPPPLSMPGTIQPRRNAAGIQLHGSEIPSRGFAQPIDQVQSTIPRQQRHQFICNSNEYMGFPNLNNSFKRRRMETGYGNYSWNPIQTTFSTQASGIQAINQIRTEKAPAQGLKPNTFNRVDVACDQGFPLSYPGGMPVELQGQKNSILAGDALQQSHRNQSIDPGPVVPNQVFINVSMNPSMNQGIEPGDEFEGMFDWNQFENQGGIQMEGTNGGETGKAP